MGKQNIAASHLGLFCLVTLISSKNEIKMKNTPDVRKNENGLIQITRMGKSIRHKRVNDDHSNETMKRTVNITLYA